MIKTIFFDLDGTLLPLKNEEFIESYLGRLAKKMAPYGYEPNKLVDAVWTGTKAMVMNDGSRTNEDAFWDCFVKTFGEKVLTQKDVFEEFYRNEFQEVKSVCGYNEKARQVIDKVKEKGFRVVLATNPLFPAMATESRIRWAGLQPEDFEVYTTYEICSYCKPNPKYYVELAERTGVNLAECLMVGNDIGEDMIPTEGLGMYGFLLTDYLIDSKGVGVDKYHHGGFDELLKFIDEL